MIRGAAAPRSSEVHDMPSLRKTKPAASPRKREGARKPRKPQARKSTDRPLRRGASSAPRLVPEMERRARNRRAVLPPASQVEPVAPWREFMGGSWTRQKLRSRSQCARSLGCSDTPLCVGLQVWPPAIYVARRRSFWTGKTERSWKVWLTWHIERRQRI